MEIPSDLNPALVPLAWLLGRWEGAGVVGYPTIESANFGQELEVSQDGRTFLRWDSRTWLLGDDGSQVRPLATETGFWRVAGPAPDAEGGGTAVEFLLAHPTGYVEIYVGHRRRRPDQPAARTSWPAPDGEGVLRRDPHLRPGRRRPALGDGHGGGGPAAAVAHARPS